MSHQYVCAFFLIRGLEKVYETELLSVSTARDAVAAGSYRSCTCGGPVSEFDFHFGRGTAEFAMHDKMSRPLFFEAICGQLLDTLCAIGADLRKCGLSRFADGKRMMEKTKFRTSR